MHFFPPFLATSMDRERSCRPSPQVAEQPAQGSHSRKLQSEGQALRLHSRSSLCGPRQGLPPFARRRATLRVRVSRPPSHVLSHRDQVVQGPQAQDCLAEMQQWCPAQPPPPHSHGSDFEPFMQQALLSPQKLHGPPFRSHSFQHFFPPSEDLRRPVFCRRLDFDPRRCLRRRRRCFFDERRRLRPQLRRLLPQLRRLAAFFLRLAASFLRLLLTPSSSSPSLLFDLLLCKDLLLLLRVHPHDKAASSPAVLPSVRVST
mmetsp:Transcript_123776/g.385443  ORF Transcript_123776/g.385443 Transcript_123776/m.385443 type:complete len:259 (-) Transcript_123776:178-954(-)